MPLPVFAQILEALSIVQRDPVHIGSVLVLLFIDYATIFRGFLLATSVKVAVFELAKRTRDMHASTLPATAQILSISCA